MPQATRCFSNQVAAAGTPAAATTPAGIQTLWQYSANQMQRNAAKEDSEAAYLDTLKEASSVPGAFKKLSDTGSSEHLKTIRKRINKIVD